MAWRTLGLSNGLWSWLKRKMYWLPHLLVVVSATFLSFFSSG